MAAKSTWPAEKFRNYVLAAASLVEGLDHLVDLAFTAGVNVSSLSKWLNGRIRPSMESLKALAHTLRVPVEDLYALAGYTEPARGLPEPPPVRHLHPLAKELDAMLSPKSALSARQRRELTALVGASMGLYRPNEAARARRSA